MRFRAVRAVFFLTAITIGGLTPTLAVAEDQACQSLSDAICELCGEESSACTDIQSMKDSSACAELNQQLETVLENIAGLDEETRGDEIEALCAY